jgi:hypothetical protein
MKRYFLTVLLLLLVSDVPAFAIDSTYVKMAAHGAFFFRIPDRDHYRSQGPSGNIDTIVESNYKLQAGWPATGHGSDSTLTEASSFSGDTLVLVITDSIRGGVSIQDTIRFTIVFDTTLSLVRTLQMQHRMRSSFDFGFENVFDSLSLSQVPYSIDKNVLTLSLADDSTHNHITMFGAYRYIESDDGGGGAAKQIDIHSITLSNASSGVFQMVLGATLKLAISSVAARAKTFQVYPNPCNTSLTLALAPLDVPTPIKVVDLLGRSVLQTTANAGSQLVRVPVSNLGQGTYELLTPSGRSTFVVSR